MSAPTIAQVPGLPGTWPAPTPVGPVIDRRRPDAELPTVPVPALSLELSYEQTAAALFEGFTDFEPLTRTNRIYLVADQLAKAVFQHGVAAIDQAAATFAELDGEEFEEVATCRTFAYRLCLAHWYQGGQARPMTVGEVAAALYLSDMERFLTTPYKVMCDHRAMERARALADHRALYQGLERVPTDLLVRLGECFTADFNQPRNRFEQPAGWSVYRQVCRDWHRRRFCWRQALQGNRKPGTALEGFWGAAPTPLLVRADCGAWMPGVTPPAPAGVAYQRPLKAWW